MGIVDDLISEAWDKAEGDTTGGGFNSSLKNLLSALKLQDGVPVQVANACWDAAIRANPQPKRGPNTAAEKDYKKRVANWLSHAEKKMTDQVQKLRDQKLAKDALLATHNMKKVQIVTATSAFEKAMADACDEWGEIKESLAHASHPKNLVSKLEIKELPPVEAESPHGHPMLAKSRAYADQLLRLRGLRNMLKKESSRPVVFDVGAGSSGVERAYKAMSKLEGGDSIYWHCTFPIACTADLSRDNMLLGKSVHAKALIEHINWVEDTGVVMKGMVNVCRHKAADCTCLGLYTARYVMAIHSHYYFTDSDWRQLFKYTDFINTAAHIPDKVNSAVPSRDPEFQWVDATVDPRMTWAQTVRAVARQQLTGRMQLAFVPLKPHGTTYIQDDPRRDVANGGFHMAPDWLNSVCETFLGSDAGMAVAHVGKLTSQILAGYGAARAAFGFKGEALRAMAAGFVFAAPAALIWAREMARSSAIPSPKAQYTVQLVNGLNLTYDGENAAQCYGYKRCPPSELEPRMYQSNAVENNMKSELAAMMVLAKGKDTIKTRAAAAARCLRDKLTPKQTVDTIAAAEAVVSEVLGNEVAPLSVAPRWNPVPAVPLCVWGALTTGTVTAVGMTSMPELVSGLSSQALAVTTAIVPACREWSSLTMRSFRDGSGRQWLGSVAPLYWVWPSQTDQRSPIARAWASTLWSTATSQHQHIRWPRDLQGPLPTNMASSATSLLSCSATNFLN